MTAETRRSNADRLLDSVQWEAVAPPEDALFDMPYLTHKGELELPGIRLQCGVLSDGRRIFYGPEIDAMVEGLKDILD